MFCQRTLHKLCRLSYKTFIVAIILSNVLILLVSLKIVILSPSYFVNFKNNLRTHTLDNQQPSTSQRNVEPTTMGEGHPATTSGVTTQSSHKPANETSQYSSSVNKLVTTQPPKLSTKTKQCKPLPWASTPFIDNDQKEIKVPIYGIPTPGDEHIFFVETSCVVNDTSKHDPDLHLSLSSRAACAVESAARFHPTHIVYVLNTCSERNASLRLDAVPAFARAALSQPNVRLWNERFSDVFLNSPLETWVLSGPLPKSKYRVSHSSDVLRFFLLWKYGGTYLDTDVLVLRSFGEERNWGCAESSKGMAVGAMHMALTDDVGRRVANASLAEMRDHFNPTGWTSNGPDALNRALRSVSEMNAERCGGFRLLPTKSFYAVPYSQWRHFFEEKDAEETLKRLKDSLGAHVWNALSHDTEVDLFSCQPYAQLARHVCPSVVSALNGAI